MSLTGMEELGSGITRGARRWALLVGIVTLLQGVWGFLLPRVFYDEFPTPGVGWVSTLGPFNDHLFRDFGSALIGLGAIALLAAVSGSVAAVGAAMCGFVVFGVLHLLFHLSTFSEFSTVSIMVQVLSLLLFVAIPIVVLVDLRRGTPEGDPT